MTGDESFAVVLVVSVCLCPPTIPIFFTCELCAWPVLHNVAFSLRGFSIGWSGASRKSWLISMHRKYRCCWLDWACSSVISCVGIVLLWYKCYCGELSTCIGRRSATATFLERTVFLCALCTEIEVLVLSQDCQYNHVRGPVLASVLSLCMQYFPDKEENFKLAMGCSISHVEENSCHSSAFAVIVTCDML